jgi:hypothetical protein
LSTPHAYAHHQCWVLPALGTVGVCDAIHLESHAR